MRVRLTQIDGALPNLALMKLSHWFKAQGCEVRLTRSIAPEPNEACGYDLELASSIFKFSEKERAQFAAFWPDGVICGTGTPHNVTVEQLIGGEYEHYDYSAYPTFDESIGFTQRGCRLNCKFCVVPAKEGRPRSASTIWQIWRGDPYPRKLHLLDNDFFGNPDWRARVAEIRDGEFKVCLSQGINVRLIDREAAEALATIEYRDTKFARRRLYTAWDNFGHERIFFRGVDLLERAGIPPKHLMAYMLVGYDPQETWPRIWHRFIAMTRRGIMPYPMVFDRARKDLMAFQRWVIRGLYRIVPWNEYERNTRTPESTLAYEAALTSADSTNAGHDEFWTPPRFIGHLGVFREGTPI